MSETILIVEDEPALRQLMARALTGAGYTVHQARNGLEATDIFRRHGISIDLVITDLEMPLVDGEKLIETLRGLRRSLKILCVSGTARTPIGVDGFIAKPVARDVFLAQVRAVLDGR